MEKVALRSINQQRIARPYFSDMVKLINDYLLSGQFDHTKLNQNFHHTGSITSRRVTSGGVHTRNVAPELRRPQETSQQ